MEINRVKKGHRGMLPWGAIGGKEGLVPMLTAPSNGLRVKMTTSESAAHMIFIPEDQLAQSGYVPKAANQKRVAKFVEIFDRSELVEMASRLKLKANGTKRELAQRILRKF